MANQLSEIKVPDIGGAENVDVIEVFVKPGDKINMEDPLIALESDKATMDVPSSSTGVVKEVKVKVGDKVSQGSVILLVAAGEQTKAADEKTGAKKEEKKEAKPEKKEKEQQVQEKSEGKAEEKPEEKREELQPGRVHAGPAVRRLAHEFDLDLATIRGTGNKDRITKEDIQQFVKSQLRLAKTGGGFALPAAPKIDFSKFGTIETQALNKIKKITGETMSRNWMSIPHVTQFGEAEITELEEFRQREKKALEKEKINLTPLVFIMKAVVSALKTYPQFNASLNETNDALILKKYFHIGVAVDTPKGLVVPVIRDVDQKGLKELAIELATISKKAREKGLAVTDMQGGCFTISSLGGIGGTAFTPIINAPEVAILGVSRAEIKPVFKNDEFQPCLKLPLSLSYDHRVIDGADGARFLMHLCQVLQDIRTLLL